MRSFVYMCFLFLAGCAVNPELYQGSLSYNEEPSDCDLIGSEVSVEPGGELTEVQELAEGTFKRSAIKVGANFILISNHSIMHINAKVPRNSGIYYRVEAKLFRCSNA